MKIIKHKFNDHIIDKETEILIIGTFNPLVECNNATFFYGRERNHLWSLLPNAFKENDLKCSSVNEKKIFMKQYKIDFIDIISQIKIDNGQESNYSDKYIDDKVVKWRNVINELSKLKKIERVFFTRKTFSGIPNIKQHINEVEKYCYKNEINFNYLLTPSRYQNKEKQENWNSRIQVSTKNNNI